MIDLCMVGGALRNGGSCILCVDRLYAAGSNKTVFKEIYPVHRRRIGKRVCMVLQCTTGLSALERGQLNPWWGAASSRQL